MIRAVVVAVAVLMFSAAAAFAFQEYATVEVAIDLTTEGNSGTTVGTVDSCLSVNVGDTFDIDIVVKDVPAPKPDGSALGIAGYGWNLHFDPAVIHITAALNSLMLGDTSKFERIVANADTDPNPNPFPATDGNTRVDFLDSSVQYESGDGVLSRLTIQAVGAGTSHLHIDSEYEGQPAPVVWQALGIPYHIGQLQDAEIKVGSPCDAAAAPTPFDPKDTYAEAYNVPTPTPGGPTQPGGGTASPSESAPAGSPTPTPVIAPVGDTKLSVDAVRDGNTATKVGPIDECASATVGETFQADVVIQGVDELLGWEALVTYDPQVLKIVDRDVKLFQAANTGSHVFDASNQTPNTNGFYRMGAVDQADPEAPDSGDGVLARLTFEVVGEGKSQISLAPQDLTGDDEPETGVLLKNVDNEAIGGQPFSGPINDAEIRVGDSCAGGATVVPGRAPTPVGVEGNGGGDSSDAWVLVGIGVAIAVLAVAGAGLFMMRRRGGGSPS